MGLAGVRSCGLRGWYVRVYFLLWVVNVFQFWMLVFITLHGTFDVACLRTGWVPALDRCSFLSCSSVVILPLEANAAT